MRATVPVVVVYRGGHGALSVARTLGRLGVPMYLVVQEGMATPVRSSRFWAGKTTWDFSRPQAESLAFLRTFGRTLGERHGARPIILTLADWVAVFIEDNAAELEEHFSFPRSTTGAVRALGDKWQMFLLAKEHGIPVPETAKPRTRNEVVAFLDVARFPIVMKAADPSLAFVPAMEFVQDSDALLAKFDRDVALGSPNVVLQEFIPGTPRDVWMCNAYFGASSECHAIFPGRKLRQVSATGIASLAVCEPNETVADQTRSFMQAVGYQGCVGIGWRYDARDGLYKVLDVNPRVSGVFRLFRATNGMDVVRICYRDLTEQAIEPSHLTVGRKWLLEDDVFAAYRAWREGSLGVREWVSSLRGVREAHWFAADDLKPFLVWSSSRTWQRTLARFDQARGRSASGSS